MATRFLASLAPACLLSIVSSTAAAQLAPRSLNGPAITSNFQDPSLHKVSNNFHAFSGPNGNPPLNVQLAYLSRLHHLDPPARLRCPPKRGPLDRKLTRCLGTRRKPTPRRKFHPLLHRRRRLFPIPPPRRRRPLHQHRRPPSPRSPAHSPGTSRQATPSTPTVSLASSRVPATSST